MSYLRHRILLDSPGCEASPGLYVSGRREPAMDSGWALASYGGRAGGGRNTQTACGDGWTLISDSSPNASLLMTLLHALVRKWEEDTQMFSSFVLHICTRVDICTHAPSSLLLPRTHRPRPLPGPALPLWSRPLQTAWLPLTSCTPPPHLCQLPPDGSQHALYPQLSTAPPGTPAPSRHQFSDAWHHRTLAEVPLVSVLPSRSTFSATSAGWDPPQLRQGRCSGHHQQ